MATGFPKLVVTAGPNEGAEFALLSEGAKTNVPVKLGRAEDNAVCLPDSSVSRYHAEIVSQKDAFLLRDLVSRNGTALGDRKLSPGEEARLRHGDLIRLGLYELKFLTSDAPVEPNPPAELEPEPQQSEPKPEAKPEPKIGPSAELTPVDAAPTSLEVSTQHEAPKRPRWRLPKIPRISRGLWIALIFSLLFLAISLIPLTRHKLVSGISSAWKAVKEFKFSHNKTVELDSKSTAQKSKTVKTAPSKQIQPTQILAVPMTTATSTLTPAGLTAESSVFLDVKTSPIPATMSLDGKRLGISPFKRAVDLKPGSAELTADFDLPDLADVYRQKVPIQIKAGQDVVTVDVKADIGKLTVRKLPRRVDFYLEGYYDYDQLKAKPAKLTDIAYGKAIYLPYGRYLFELREMSSLTGTQNLVSKVRYQREYRVNAESPAVEISVTDDDLKNFPVVITSDPTDAIVKNGDAVLGNTPYKGNLPVGNNHLIVTKDGYFDKELDINAAYNSVYEARVTLETSKLGAMINDAKTKIHTADLDGAISVLVDALKYGGSAHEKSEVYYLLGETYSQKNDYAQAKPCYDRARANPDFAQSATLGLAIAEQKLGNSDTALLLTIQVLANLEKTDPVELRAAAYSTFKKISPIKSVIYIVTDPPGASVFLNDKKLDQASPLILRDLDLGNYRVEIEKPGFEPYQTKQNLQIGDFSLIKVKLKPMAL